MLMPETEPHESCLLGQLNISLEICNYYQLSTGKLSTVTVLYHIISDIRRGKYCPAPLLFRRQAVLFHKITAVGATAVGVTAVRNNLNF